MCLRNAVVLFGIVFSLLLQPRIAYLLLPSKELLAFNASIGVNISPSSLVEKSSQPEIEIPELSGQPYLDKLCDNDNAPQHSGYLNAGPDARYFYWLAESRSKPSNQAPLILWMTGGPGCSSILALLTENGPCKVVDGESGTTAKNPWSWTELANVLWVDQPAGTGFSFGNFQPTVDDVANRMYLFLRNFFKAYSWLLAVPFFIFGESYAGHYIPVLATTVLERQARGGVAPVVGIGLGNAVVDLHWMFASKPEMAFTGGIDGSLGHGSVSRSVAESMKQHLPECLALTDACQTDRRACWPAYYSCNVGEIAPVVATSGRNPYDLRQSCHEQNPVDCFDFSQTDAFLRNSKIKDILRASSAITWSMCNYHVNAAFVLSGDFMESVTSSVISLLNASVPVLVYNGDDDSTVDWIGSKLWVEHLDWKHRDSWSQLPDLDFVVADNTSGRQRSFGGLTYLQIYDAGHMVPSDQPEVALEMVRTFIRSASTWRDTNVNFAAPRRSSLTDSFWLLVTAGSMVVVLVMFLHSCFIVASKRASERQADSYYLQLN